MTGPTCRHCDRPFPPYGVGVPLEHREDYCWGDRRTLDVSMELNFAVLGGQTCPVRVLVDVPLCAEDAFCLAAEAAKDAIRPFLRGEVHFGEQDPMSVGVHRMEDR